MRVTTAGHHAVRIMLDLALHDWEAPVLRHDISKRQVISSDYIAQLIRKLNKGGLIKSIMGPAGGYSLAHPASQIRVGDIIRAVEGPIETSYCVSPGPLGFCGRKETCTVHKMWVELSEVIDNYLNGITLQDLCEQSNSLEHINLPDLDCMKENANEVISLV
jgi:Rrf2 family transcriptional regulator, iron-sulfur cluster assembly transcription factor